MSLVDDDSLSLAGLDAPDFLQLDNSFSSSLTAHCHSFCTTATCMRNPKGPRPLHLVTVEKGHSSPASNHSGGIFKPLPPVPHVSSFHLSVIWNLHTGSLSVDGLSPPALTRKSTLSGSSIGATDGNHAGPSASLAEIPESPRPIYVSTDPYSPWPSPVRRHFMSRSDDSFSRISRYSRPESRSGARAPDPPSRRTSLAVIGCNIPGVRRVRRFTRNVRLFTQRIHTLKAVLRNVHRREPVIPRTSTTRLPRRTSARVSRASSITSFVQSQSLRTSTSSALSSSLQRWLEAKSKLTHEVSSDHASITISQYELRGSWLADDLCGSERYDARPSPPQSPWKSIADLSVSSTPTEDLVGKYVSVSLRAGEEASRRRRRSSNRTVTWSSSESEIDSLEYS